MMQFVTTLISKIKAHKEQVLWSTLFVLFFLAIGVSAFILLKGNPSPILNTHLVKASGGYAYKNTTNTFKTQFKANPTTLDGIVFENSIGKISFYTPITQSFGELKPPGFPATSGSTITYRNIFPQMDLSYTITSSRLLEEFIVKDAITAQFLSRIEQRAKTDSTYTENEDGSISFFNPKKDNALAFTLPHPVMYEVGNPNQTSTGIIYEITPYKDQLVITKVITEEGVAWLANKNRNYPIAIDLVIDNADASSNWVSSDATATVVSQETTIKQEGTGSTKVQTMAGTGSTNLDLMEYSSDGTAQTNYVSSSAFSATGGTITYSGGYTIHTFTGSGTFTPNSSGNVNMLVVGGGGSGSDGGTSGRPGGGGGKATETTQSLTAQAYAVTVGGVSGTSSFGALVSNQGGGTASGLTAGGSGSGYAGCDGNGGAGGGNNSGGGCGGGDTGGSGGIGMNSSLSGSILGYGGGGGGGSNFGGAASHGGGVGNGGGGRANSGGGGGGGGSASGGAGGGAAGIVIVQYPDTPLQSYSEASTKTQGSYALRGVAAITTGLNKTLTRTIGSPINLSGSTSVTFDIRSTRTGSNIKVGIQDVGGITTEVTPNITSANTFQSASIDLSAVTNANKDAIDQIIITIVNADAANTFYIDNMVAVAPSSLNDMVTRTVTSTNLSAIANISYWVRSTVAGAYSTFGFGEAAATEQTNTITINSVNTWEQKSWDITGITGTSRDAVTKYMILFQGDTSGASFYLDDIQTNALFAPTLGTATSLSSTSIRWNFTDNSTEETGFKIYDASSNLLVTCSATNLTYCDETGLTPNTQYTRKIGTYNVSFSPIPTGTVSGYTLAAVPSVPVVNTRTTTTVQVNPDPGTNPASTTMAIYKETGTTCDGSGGSYIAANGSEYGSTDDGSATIWQTDATWGTAGVVTVTGLTSETAYSFCVKARNANNVQTAFSSVGQNNSGYIPLSGNFAITANTTILNKYVDGSDATRYVMGVDSGTANTNSAILDLQSGVLTVNANETVVAGSFSLDGGSIAIADGGQLKPGSALWAIDADADGYTSDAKLYYGSQPTSGRRKNLITTLGTADCGDSSYSTSNVCCSNYNYYLDSDNDTYGAGSAVPYCQVTPSTPAGYSTNNTDCNNANASVYRTVAGYLDSDSDGYGVGAYSTCVGATGSYVASNTDCYDSNASAYPGSATCGTSNRGDGSYDYNCSGGNSTCGTIYNYSYVGTIGYKTTVCWGGDCAMNAGTSNYVSASIGCGSSGYAGCAAGGTLTVGCSTFENKYGDTVCNNGNVYGYVCWAGGASGIQACQ